MVKPVFKALFDMKAAATADEAEKIAIAFLTSPEAQKVNRAQAGKFVKDIDTMFAALKAPNHYERVLNTITAVQSSASYDLQEFATFALRDFADISRYSAEASTVLAQNAIVLKGVIEAENRTAAGKARTNQILDGITRPQKGGWDLSIE